MTTEDSITIIWTTSPTVTSAVVSWEVSDGSTTRAVRQSDREDSGLIIWSNRYTILGLMSSTEYDITVTVINAAGNNTYSVTHSTAEGNPGNPYTTGSTDSHSIIISTDTVNCDSASSEADNTAAVIGGVVVAIVLIVSITTAVTVIIIYIMRYRRGNYSTQKRLAVYHYHYMYVDYYTVHTERL